MHVRVYTHKHIYNSIYNVLYIDIYGNKKSETCQCDELLKALVLRQFTKKIYKRPLNLLKDIQLHHKRNKN